MLLKELAQSLSIDAAAVYLIEENEMRLKSSVGFPEEYAREASAIWKGRTTARTGGPVNQGFLNA